MCNPTLLALPSILLASFSGSTTPGDTPENGVTALAAVSGLVTNSSASEASLPTEALVPEGEPDFWDALSGGSAWLNFRYRFENVDQQGFAKDANASTLRTVLGYKTLPYRDFTGVVEFEDVHVLGDTRYNDTVNGKTAYPVVADPEGTEINQAYVDYDGFTGTKIRGGRQEVILDNARFVGNVVWRQNHQSFDAATVSYDGTEDLSLFYGSFFNVNRIFGDGSAVGDAALMSHLLNGRYEYSEDGAVGAYLYHLDFDDMLAASTTTYGARATNRFKLSDNARLDTVLEAAHQKDAGDNPTDVSATYTNLKVDATVDAVTFGAGWEVLGGSSGVGDKFTTPLATLFKFNGWADQFLATPDAGLDDFSIGVQAKLEKLVLAGYYHDFSEETGGGDFGTELDLIATYPVSDEVTVELRYADFDSDDPAFTDVRKVWLSLIIKP